MAEVTLIVRVPSDLLNLGLSQDEIQHRILEWLVLSLFSEGKISSGKAGKLLGLARIEFINLLQARGCAFLSYSKEELAEEIEVVNKLKLTPKK